MSTVSAFDVFLSHNSKDKPAVRELKRLLAAHGLTVWMDEDELRPGMPWQQLLELGINTSSSVAVLVGRDGLGPWEDEEMQAALRLAVKYKRPVIPVLLPGAPAEPELPLFLTNRTWVDLRAGLTEDGVAKLVWGVTGKKPSGRRRQGVVSGSTGDNQSARESPRIVQRPQPTAGPSKALAMWREKLAFLQEQEALLSDPAQRFAVRKQIEEAQAKIQELGG